MLMLIYIPCLFIYCISFSPDTFSYILAPLSYYIVFSYTYNNNNNNNNKQNLLKAVGTSNEETKDISQSKLIEAKLRADLLHTRSECLEVTEEKLIAYRSLELITIDLSNLKKERIQLKNDKIRLERERRSAQSLVDNYAAAADVRNSEKNNSSDVEYYKRKAVELETHLQGMTARLGEKNREIHELRRDRDRNLSQNRLAALKASAMGGSGGNGNGGGNNKKSRHSY
jgi:hypothetical protein